MFRPTWSETTSKGTSGLPRATKGSFLWNSHSSGSTGKPVVYLGIKI